MAETREHTGFPKQEHKMISVVLYYLICLFFSFLAWYNTSPKILDLVVPDKNKFLYFHDDGSAIE